MQQQALSAIVAWVRLDQAIEKLNAHLRKDFGVTGLQLAILRILAERPALPLAALRKALVMHPATLGQAVDELRKLGFCTVARDERDRRARLVAITEAGASLLERAPLAGPVRLRAFRTSPQRLEKLAGAFEDAIDLFGLKPWAPPKRKETRDE
jgi:DNA-binding MarR family transcriptional regulator